MKTMRLVAMIAGAVVAGSVFAQPDVVKSKCMTCHAVDQKKMGPSFKDVSAKYKGDPGAEGTLTAKLKEGKGHPKVAASDAELKAAVGFVLSQ
jgi:cytochrome c